MRSLRSRLLFTVIGMTLVVYVLSAIGLYEYLEYKEESNLKATLSQQWELVAGLIEEEDDGQRIELELDQLTSGKFVERYSGRYYVVEVSGQSPILSLSLGGSWPEFANQQSSTQIFESVGPAHEELLVMSQDYTFAQRQIRVTVAESRADVERWLEAIRQALLFGLPVLLLILGLLLIWVIHLAFKPLEHLIQQLADFDFYQQSELKQSEHEVVEIRKLNTAFNKLLSRFQKIRASEEQLLMDVSHQLKTPLTVILSTCDIILRRERESERYKQALKQVQDTGRGMRTLINRLLSAAHLSSENRQMEHFRVCDLNEIARDAVKKAQFLSQQKEVSLNFYGDDALLIDGIAERLEELLLILIENAVLYSPPNTEIRVSTQKQSQEAVLQIKDQGPGISAEDIPFIFQRFFRGKNTVSIPGTGLGLTLAKQIVELHKGKISVVQHGEGGSCFQCVFPLNS